MAMADFNVRADSVDVEQIMRQIRARIREKRGADYTEAELQELAKVKLEKFLDPRGVRSDLLEQFARQQAPSPEIPKLVPHDVPIYDSHRSLLVGIRRLLNPILKLFINPNPIIHSVHQLTIEQADINAEFDRRFRQRERMDPLYYQVIHNLVIELTRAGIEVHNLKMRLESLSSRLDFEERRGRSLERVVEYRPGAMPQRPASAPPSQGPPREAQVAPAGRPEGPRPDSEGGGGERRRRRRRRRRRPGQTLGDQQGWSGSSAANGPGGPGAPPDTGSHDDARAPEPPDDDGPDDDGAPDQ
jgi:hypothetical protein